MGASHVTLGCVDIGTASARLAAYGYEAEFIETELRNDRSKYESLSAWSDVHAIALMRSGSGFPIELVSYPVPVPRSRGALIAIFGSGNLDTAHGDRGLTAVRNIMRDEGDHYRAGYVDGLELPALSPACPSRQGLTGLAVAVTELARARVFWCEGLGFECVRVGLRVAKLSLPAPIKTWRIEVTLVQAKMPEGKPLLNARGMTCLSFVSSDVQRDAERLSSFGALGPTEPFPVQVDRRTLHVVMLCFDGTFIELLQVMPRT